MRSTEKKYIMLTMREKRKSISFSKTDVMKLYSYTPAVKCLAKRSTCRSSEMLKISTN